MGSQVRALVRPPLNAVKYQHKMKWLKAPDAGALLVQGPIGHARALAGITI
jgi:hypothetical protein